MIKIIAKQDFSIGENLFIKGDEIPTKNYDTIIKLNEAGLIEPLEYKDLVLIKREIENPKKEKKEEK